MTPVQDPDPRPLPGEPLALDLLNTQWLASGSPVDQLTTPEGTRTWLAAAGVTAAPAQGTREALVTTRQAIRRWCSMASCGNRAKAHRHYDRVKKTR